jgi:hypothetical protein
MIHALKSVEIKGLTLPGTVTSYCGCKGEMFMWSDKSVNRAGAFDFVKPFVTDEVRSQRWWGHIAKLNPAITCDECKTLVMKCD